MWKNPSTQLVRFLPMFADCIHVKRSWMWPTSFTFEKKLITVKCSSGHVECSFDNPTETFPTKIRIFLHSKSEKKYNIKLFS